MQLCYRFLLNKASEGSTITQNVVWPLKLQMSLCGDHRIPFVHILSIIVIIVKVPIIITVRHSGYVI